MTAAMPPCAQLVAVSSILDFVTMQTFPCFATLMAKVRPAIPDPITRKSTFFLMTFFKGPTVIL
jgi:hypothetical protein